MHRNLALKRAFWTILGTLAIFAIWGPSRSEAQALGEPDRGQPGDLMIQAYLKQEAEKLETQFLAGVKTADDWVKQLPKLRGQYFHMLGLYPLPERTDLKAKVVGGLNFEGFAVDRVHFQSRPGLYVTGNLYRPTNEEPGKKLPAVLYVCGHSNRGVQGNKTAYQSHPIWFARHGYVCLAIDTLQLGEISAIHHGTYKEDRWWWISRGYTPAGVECWNGIRAIDYLTSRPDVDADRIAVTGISGGGAATFWIAAADERVKVAVPVSGMADLESYVPNRVVNGHCDCMFFNNTFMWPWTTIACMIAPRPLLFVNSDNDSIFPMDANNRVANRMEKFYSVFGASDRFDSMVSIGGHAYRKDIRQSSFRFINTWLKGDARIVDDSETYLVEGEGKDAKFPIDPEALRVFATAADVPKDQINTTVDQHFVPMAKLQAPKASEFVAWRDRLIQRMKRVSFSHFPDRVPIAKKVEGDEVSAIIETEAPIRLALRRIRESKKPAESKRVVLVAIGPDPTDIEKLLGSLTLPEDAVYALETRGVGSSKWTRKNPPNYVERAHLLLGRTVDSGRIWDIVSAARYLKVQAGKPVYVIGEGGSGILAAYAALLEPEIEVVGLLKPPKTHYDSKAPQLLNILREFDIPEALGLLAPRMLVLSDADAQMTSKVGLIHDLAGPGNNTSPAPTTPPAPAPTAPPAPAPTTPPVPSPATAPAPAPSPIPTTSPRMLPNFSPTSPADPVTPAPPPVPITTPKPPQAPAGSGVGTSPAPAPLPPLTPIEPKKAGD